MTSLIILFLIFVACVSPILTYSRLWQMKEWRWDRLIDHLKSEGWFRQIVGIARPLIATPWIILGLLSTLQLPELAPLSPLQGAIIGLSMLAMLSIITIALSRQQHPVWTGKAIILTCLALLFSIGIGSIVIFCSQDWSATVLMVVTIPLLQPLILVLCWLIFMPIDRWQKASILEQATTLRRSFPQLCVIGITGSVGKTTTKELIAHLLAPEGAIATPLHVNTEMGIARWLLQVLRDEPRDSRRILVVEMGAYRRGEIGQLAEIAQPTIGVVTYVGHQHVSLFGSEEAIARGKGELLAGLPSSGQAFVHADSPLLDLLISQATVRPRTVGTGPDAMIRAEDIEETGGGVRFKIEGIPMAVPMAGTHNVTNVLLAISVAKSLGVSLTNLQQRLATFTSFEGSFSVRDAYGVTVLDSTYNASYESFAAAIRWASERNASEKILLWSGIIELGDNEERLHRLLATEASRVFQRSYAVQARFASYFHEAFGSRQRLASEPHERLSPGSLLVCMGRMPSSIMASFLPNKEMQK